MRLPKDNGHSSALSLCESVCFLLGGTRREANKLLMSKNLNGSILTEKIFISDFYIQSFLYWKKANAIHVLQYKHRESKGEHCLIHPVWTRGKISGVFGLFVCFVLCLLTFVL